MNGQGPTAQIDVVVVSYNSAEELPRCLEPLLAEPSIAVTVVDNASGDESADVVARLPVRGVPLGRNGGFAQGCNVGWHAGAAPYVLFLNPDARIEAADVLHLRDVLRDESGIGVVAPRVVDLDGELALTQRRFPRRLSTFALALFVHRAPGGRHEWGDDTVREPADYLRPGDPDWVAGACLMLRRADLERLGGWDERFFLYREDVDLCRRVRALGLGIRFDPHAVAVHRGGASAPQAHVVPLLAASRIRYARKYGGRRAAALERVGVALHALTHAAVGRGGPAVRASHLRALLATARPRLHDPRIGAR